MIRAILTDIEGTTSSISFVKDVLFPYARRELPRFVRERGDDPQVRRWLDAVAAEHGGICDDAVIVEVLQGWIDADRKHTALKALQGMLWKDGYASGDFTAHVYPDAVERLRAWHAAGLPLYVYSSGSVPAQKLFFGHSDAGDLTPLVSGWFDTETGGKRDPESYRSIAATTGFPHPTSCSCPTWSRNWTPRARRALRPCWSTGARTIPNRARARPPTATGASNLFPRLRWTHDSPRTRA